jgi:nucleotide-binding universal stress UspA family protein
MFRNILVAVDGSPDAAEALTDAIDLAESEHTRLTLITAVRQIPATGLLVPGAVTDDAIADTRAWAQTILRRALDQVPDDLPVSTVLSDQPIRPALIRQIKDGHHDLIVMGSRGRGAVRSALLGSVSHYALDHSPVPILIVHAEQSAAAEVRRPAAVT